MLNKTNKTSFKVKPKKYHSEVKFRYTHNHALNRSPAKNVPSFKTGSQRLHKPKLLSPDKFYDLPEFKIKKSASFGFGTKTNFAKKEFVDPTKYNITSKFDLASMQRIPGPSFGISRQDFYKGKSPKGMQNVGPGNYNVELIKKKATFYIGKKFKRNDQTTSPGPGAYNLRTEQTLTQIRQSRHTQKCKAPKICTQYFQKEPLQRYDNRVPGPGAYDLSWFSSGVSAERIKVKKSTLPQCPRFLDRKQKIPAPGAQQFLVQNSQLFSEFGG